ncbi:MAG: hypothetical protein LUQ41_06330, partial [Methanomicrobiales archaeon]|nr:hypothetical protein [Methanomicrobiales archaeon]
ERDPFIRCNTTISWLVAARIFLWILPRPADISTPLIIAFMANYLPIHVDLEDRSGEEYGKKRRRR